jgi:hypothetical protein
MGGLGICEHHLVCFGCTKLKLKLKSKFASMSVIVRSHKLTLAQTISTKRLGTRSAVDRVQLPDKAQLEVVGCGWMPVGSTGRCGSFPTLWSGGR